MKRLMGLLAFMFALAGVSQVVRAQTSGDAIFCSGFEVGDDGSCPGLSSLSDGFDDISTLVANGWILVNHSDPVGTTSWLQGSTDPFPSQAGAGDAYIAANYQNTSGAGTISDWLVTPVLSFGPNTTVSFWTRVKNNPAYWPDRLEIRLCTGSICTDVGSSSSDVGDFTTKLLSINPLLMDSGYPAIWTEYTLNSSFGLPTSGQGRIAFRYYVIDAGEGGDNSNYIGIDSVSVN